MSENIRLLIKQKNILITSVPQVRKALAELSAQAYGYPAQKLKLVGVTGTDGKTTSAYLLFYALKAAGKRVALLSGVEHILTEQVTLASLTTPKPDYLHYFLDQCVQQEIEYVVIELSAQAITYNRIEGLSFDGLIFTNLAREHGERYKTLEEYFETKCAILKQNKKEAPLIVNVDNSWGERVKQLFPQALTSSKKIHTDYQFVSLQQTFSKQLLEIKIKREWKQFQTPLTGLYNAQNIVGVVALADQLGLSLEKVALGIEQFNGAPGRLERYRLPNNAWIVIDYAHTPQAYASILPMLKEQTQKLYVIFGAGGGKDKEKRPMMGKAAAQYADEIILTNDNPRADDPQKIMDDIIADCTAIERLKIYREPDRAQAIKYAYQKSCAGDIIAVLGKGHEITQTIGTVCLHHNDREVVLSLI